MTIKLKNTLSGKTEEFKSIKPGHVGMYNCGPTVYYRAHVGHARPYVFADLLRRMFEYHGFKVNQVINITDVGHLVSDADYGEDKLEKAARERGEKTTEIAEKYTKDFMDNLTLLNIKTEKTLFPKATEHIKEQIDIIKILKDKGLTYKTTDGIYFDTSKIKNYGKLGNIDLEGLKEGARVEANTEKRNLTDFALWKFSTLTEKREQEWDSPWGVGFPGWHIECSAMSKKYLGEVFDIHTGGIDHIPTHHNNEIAQSESAFGKIQANYWLHSNFVNFDGKKIAKSSGNGVYLSELKEKGISPLAYRYWILTSHYSTLTNFTWEAIESAANALDRLIKMFVGTKPGSINQNYIDQFIEKIDDDLNTPEAIAVIWKMLKDDSVSNEDKLATVLEADKILGLDLDSQILEKSNIPKKVIDKATEREKARRDKDFIKSDNLRDEIEKLGYEIKDTDEGFEITSN